MPINSPWYRVVSQGGGSYRSIGVFGGDPRLVAVRPLRDYPLVVDVSIDEAQALAPWWRRAIFIAVGSLLMVICSVLLLKALTSQFHRLKQSEASLAEREAMLAEKSSQLEVAHMQIDAALNNIPQGLLMFDSDARLVVINERYIEMYGLSRDVVKPGCSLRTLIQHRKDVGLFKGDPELYCNQILKTIAAGKAAGQLIETTDGRTDLRGAAAAGGWRLGRHARRHHRAQARRRKDGVHGPPRCADGARQSGAAARKDGGGAGAAAPARRGVLVVRLRSRLVQVGQRFPRSPDRRSAAHRGCAATAVVHA